MLLYRQLTLETKKAKSNKQPNNLVRFCLLITTFSINISHLYFCSCYCCYNIYKRQKKRCKSH